jgi:hypothetical protein
MQETINCALRPQPSQRQRPSTIGAVAGGARSRLRVGKQGHLPVLYICSRGLDHPRRTKGSSSGWSHHLAVELLRRSTGQTARFMDFVAAQLVGLFSAHFYSAPTLPSTSWLGCSVLDSSPTKWSDCSSLRRQLRRASLVKLGILWRSDSSSLHRQLR